jgi:hypothetical protein
LLRLIERSRDIELNSLAFLQAAEAASLNSRKMYKHVFAILKADKAAALVNSVQRRSNSSGRHHDSEAGQSHRSLPLRSGNACAVRDRAPDGRVIAVMAAKAGAATLTSYLLKRYNIHVWKIKLWYLPLAFNGYSHALAAGQNMRNCDDLQRSLPHMVQCAYEEPHPLPSFKKLIASHDLRVVSILNFHPTGSRNVSVRPILSFRNNTFQVTIYR